MTNQPLTEVQEIDDLEHETVNAILMRRNEKVKMLYDKVESLFAKGNDCTRTIIANKFILPISHLLEMNFSRGQEYLNLLPTKLKSEYTRQIYSSSL